MPSLLSIQLITRHPKLDFWTSLLLCKDIWAARTLQRGANVCSAFQAHPTAERRKKTIYSASLLLSASYLNHHQIFSRQLFSWKIAGKRIRIERDTVTQQYAASLQPFCNRRLKREHEFHLLSFTVQQKYVLNAWKWGHCHTWDQMC